jgi:two-component system, LytTR family, response regulator
MNYSFLVVDDEKLSRSYISDMITEFVPNSVIRDAHSAKSAKPILESEPIDVLFLDIKMPGVSGFELLESLPNRNFELIFVTAFKDYALKAIKNDACDYLLKPVKKSDFKVSIQKAIEKRDKVNASRDAKKAFDQALSHYQDSKLTISHQQGTKVIALKDIIYLKADNTYTTIFLTTGEKIITSKPINRYEDALDPNWFFRVHKSYIVNIFHLKEYLSKEDNAALMDNGEQIYISRYRLTHFLEVLKNSGIKV